MSRQTKKIIAGITSIFAGYGIGILIYFILDAVNGFSRHARYLPVVFSVGFVVMIVTFILYWLKAKKLDDYKKKNLLRGVCAGIGCLLCIACVAVVEIVFHKALESTNVTVAILIETITIILGNIFAYIFGKI